MYRKHLCTKCQAELPPEEASVPARKSKTLLRVAKVLFFPVYVALFPLFVLGFKVLGFVRRRDAGAYYAPLQYGRYGYDAQSQSIQDYSDDWFRYRKPEYTYWRLWDNEPEETKPK